MSVLLESILCLPPIVIVLLEYFRLLLLLVAILLSQTLPGSVPGHNIEHILVINYDAYQVTSMYMKLIINSHFVCQSSSYEHIREIRRPVTILDFYFVEMSDSEEPPSQYPNKQGKLMLNQQTDSSGLYGVYGLQPVAYIAKINL